MGGTGRRQGEANGQAKGGDSLSWLDVVTSIKCL